MFCVGVCAFGVFAQSLIDIKISSSELLNVLSCHVAVCGAVLISHAWIEFPYNQ